MTTEKLIVKARGCLSSPEHFLASIQTCALKNVTVRPLGGHTGISNPPRPRQEEATPTPACFSAAPGTQIAKREAVMCPRFFSLIQAPEPHPFLINSTLKFKLPGLPASPPRGPQHPASPLPSAPARMGVGCASPSHILLLKDVASSSFSPRY